MAGDAGLRFYINGVQQTDPATGSANQYWPGGRGVFAVVSSAFNAATVHLQRLGPDGVTLIDVSTATNLTANGMAVFDCDPCLMVVTFVGGTPTTAFAAAGRVVS